MKNLTIIKAQAIEAAKEVGHAEAFAEYRETVRGIQDAMKTVIACYNETRYGKTDDTVAAIVNALGYDNAMVAIAQLVNTVGDWDERVGSKARRWAASIEDAAERDEMRDAGIFQPSAIHPAHIDQLAHAAERFTAWTPEELDEIVAEAATAEVMNELNAQEAQEAQEAAQDRTEDENTKAAAKPAQEAKETPSKALRKLGRKLAKAKQAAKDAAQEVAKDAKRKAQEADARAKLAKMTTPEALLYFLCTNHRGKMAGMVSFSTSVRANPICQARREAAAKAVEIALATGRDIPEVICIECYAAAQLEYQAGTDIKYTLAYEFLNAQLYEIEDFPLLNVRIARIEAFGDVGSVTQARNYIRFALRNPETTITAWTKNPRIWAEAFKAEDVKPANLIMIYSDPLVNGSAIMPEAFLASLRMVYPWVDKLFVVYDEDDAQTVEINCGARNCLTCARCYTHGTEEIIRELKK